MAQFLFCVQSGPLEKVKIPFDSVAGKNKSFAFITFKHIESVPYTMNLMNGIRLFGQTLKLQARPGSVHEQVYLTIVCLYSFLILYFNFPLFSRLKLCTIITI